MHNQHKMWLKSCVRTQCALHCRQDTDLDNFQMVPQRSVLPEWNKMFAFRQIVCVARRSCPKDRCNVDNKRVIILNYVPQNITVLFLSP